jgi:hypothetical protein
MSCDSRIREPCKVSEVFPGVCLVGRSASALGTLLGFNTHLSGHNQALLQDLCRSQPGYLYRSAGLVIRFVYTSK